MNTFNTTTEKRLESLFSYLPEIFFWTVIVTRLFIAVPIFKAATVHFQFLEYPWLIILNSFLSVAIVESILTLPSLSTAFFKRFDMKRYQTIAFWTTIILGLFNQSLILLAWRDTNMGKEAFYMYTVFNLASIVLAEFIGFMTQNKRAEMVQVQPQEEEQEVPSLEEKPEPRRLSANDKIRIILDAPISDMEKMYRIVEECQISARQAATMFNISHTTISNKVRKFKEEYGEVTEIPELENHN